MSTMKAINYLLLLLSAYSYINFCYCQFEDDFPDIDWQNETQLDVFDGNNTTNLTLDSIYTISNISSTNPRNDSNMENVQHQQFIKVAICALLLHVLIVAMGLIIYSYVYYKARAERKRQRSIGQYRFSLSNVQHQHLPNLPNCQCQGCCMAREIFHTLILQQMQQMVEC